MPTGDSVGVGVALLAGLLSFLSPCVLPLVPVYLGYLSGTAGEDPEVARRRTPVHAAAFVGGFSLVFVLLGCVAGLAGYVVDGATGALGLVGQAANWITLATPWLARIGGVLLIVLGLHLTGLVRIPFLYRELRFENTSRKTGSVWTSILVGMAFAAGWTPCVGPYLMAILMLAGNSATVGQGAFLLAVYSLGLGLPFMVAGFALQAVATRLRRWNRYLQVVSIVGGVLLIAMGVLLALGRWMWLNGILNSLWRPLA